MFYMFSLVEVLSAADSVSIWMKFQTSNDSNASVQEGPIIVWLRDKKVEEDMDVSNSEMSVEIVDGVVGNLRQEVVSVHEAPDWPIFATVCKHAMFTYQNYEFRCPFAFVWSESFFFFNFIF
jgi:hypothetical protein